MGVLPGPSGVLLMTSSIVGHLICLWENYKNPPWGTLGSFEVLLGPFSVLLCLFVGTSGYVRSTYGSVLGTIDDKKHSWEVGTEIWPDSRLVPMA